MIDTTSLRDHGSIRRLSRKGWAALLRLALLSAALAAGCTSPAATSTEEVGVVATPDVPAVTEMRQSIAQYGVTWTFDRPVAVGKFITGDYFVVGPVTVASISPAADGSAQGFRNGSMLNPPTTSAQAYDGRIRGFNAELAVALPLKLEPGDSLVSAVSLDELQQNRILPNPTRATETSPLRTLAVLTCLASVPPADAFRPGYCDLQKERLLLARNIRWEQLPSVEAASAPVHGWARAYDASSFDDQGRPSWAWLERALERPWIDHLHGWASREMHAVETMPGYGRETARAISYAALMLCSDAPQERKERLAMSLIQIGIDNWSVARRSKLGQSGGWPAAGGFGNGRKLPIVFAAALLDDQEMLNMSGEAPEASFGEDEHTEFGPSWTGARVRFTGQYPLAYKAEPERYLDRGPYEHLTPDKWPGRNATMSESYRRCCTSISWVGQALAVRLLRAEQVWNHEAFFVYVDRWMYENDEEAMAKIRQSHSNYGGMRQGSTHFDPWIDAMWKAHRTTLEAGIDDWKPRR